MSLSKNRKIASGLAAFAAAGSLLVGGVYAAFTDTAVTAPQTVAAGTVTLGLADSQGSTPPVMFTQSVNGLAPGDVNYRALTVQNAGTLGLASLDMTTSTSQSNALTSDPIATGLAVSVDLCSVAWTIGSPTAAPTCGGTTTPVMAPINLDGLTASTPIRVPGGALTAGGSSYLMFKYALSASTPDTMEGLSTDVTYTFNAVQRAGGIIDSQ